MNIKHGLFVTGTDTDIGKTVVSAILVAALRRRGGVKYWKPVQTGIESDDDTRSVESLAQCTPDEIFEAGIRLERPLSPHLSAKIAGIEFGIEEVIRFLPDNMGEKTWIVEGAGGVLVPLNDRELMIDLIKAMKIPAVVVSRSGLGTINHTLMTLESLRSREIEIAGVIMNGPENPENRFAIERYGRIRVLAEVPMFEEISPESVAEFAGKLEINMRSPREAG